MISARPRPIARTFRSAAALGCVGLLAGLSASFGCAGTDKKGELEAELEAELAAAKDRKPAECHPDYEEPCYSGAEGTAGRGICREGKRTCDKDGFWLECVGEQPPAEKELCNKIDDDCNGVVDDGFQREGTKCWNGKGECRSEGTYSCSEDQTESICSAPVIEPKAEKCDGKDNDCDGETDEDAEGTGATCQTGQKGACAEGVNQCVAGAIKCMPKHIKTFEVCDNNVDDDCDGQTDEKDCADPNTAGNK